MKKYYVAYGSNLNLIHMKFRCPNAKLVGSSFINDYQLLFKNKETRNSYLTIEKCLGSKLPVGIFEVNSEDEKNLDIYEDYPELYYKKDIEIILNNKTINAFIYIMYEDQTKLGVPKDSYLKECLKGYEDFGFDEAYLDKAYEMSLKNR